MVLETNMEEQVKYHAYVTAHVENVKRAYREYVERLTKLMKIDPHKLRDLVEVHDSSKFSEAEAISAARYFSDEPNAHEKYQEDYNYSWLNHQNVNPHHPEYWVMRDDNNTTILEMPDIYIAEMVLDWQAMAYKFGGTPLTFYESKGKDKPLAPGTRKVLEYVLKELFEDE